MAKYKVIKDYVDRITKEDRYAGMSVELTEARAEELEAAGYIEKPKKKVKKNGK